MKETKIITNPEIIEAIKRSGYLLEQRVEAILIKNSFYVSTNAPYPDPLTGKSREIDVDAIKWYKITKDYDSLYCRLLCECENNSQPVVFFVQKNRYFPCDGVFKCAGIPVKFIGQFNSSQLRNDKSDTTFMSLFDFLRVDSFHHYCRNRIATQYCTFTRRNEHKPWVAFHSDTQHETFTALINALEANIDDYYSSYGPPKAHEVERFNIEIYYLALILQGPLYVASTTRSKVKLSRTKHVQFRKEVFSRDTHDTYQIDVVTEKFLPRYLTMIEEEIQKINNRLKRKKKLARASMDLLIETAKKKNKEQTYREIFEF